MIGHKRISELITDPNAIIPGYINIIEAPVSSGKTHLALNTIPAWASSASKILYLIDTTNGEMRIQKNIRTVGRQTYSFYHYGKKSTWGERSEAAENNMPVMTYAGFGCEVRDGGSAFKWHDYDFIICDEMQNLVNYQKYKQGTKNVETAEDTLRAIAAEGKTKIVALSATPQQIRERFGDICYDVPFDRSDLFRLETFAEIPYCGSIEEILLRHKGQTGILYTTEIQDMKRYMDFANKNGIRANGFWSVNANTRMNQDQLDLRHTILENEAIPANVDLLVINAASQTCIKIQGEKRKVDYMIVHYSNEEVKTQVRGRYHGDLPIFYYHDVKAANHYRTRQTTLPECFLNTRLYSDTWKELCEIVSLTRPHGGSYSMPTVAKYLQENGYDVMKKKDSKRNGQYYYVITTRETNCGNTTSSP
ncbi:MAG: DEAD/DEAH box helicase family protein [Clostridia bacterium]|nr:DEAD/DEAH box helicase family protein [Clostridia bacterium]